MAVQMEQLMAQQTIAAGTKKQYLKYPYPARNPEDERSRLIAVPAVDLSKINKLFWLNRKIFDKFRALDAGCGTGDAVISLGEQLKDTRSEIVALDFSKSSLNIAKKRANIRELKNITFVNDSVMNIPNLNLGKFDLIICTGVLHHLENPKEALKNLANVLKKDGLLIIMVYGKYGRAAIYMVQKLLKQINDGEDNMKTKIDNAREIIRKLPKSHWFQFSKSIFEEECREDGQLYDLLLHGSDRPYTVPEIYELLDLAGLELIQFANKGEYDPKKYLNESLKDRIEKLPRKQQEAIAELLNGRMIMHTFIARKKSAGGGTSY